MYTRSWWRARAGYLRVMDALHYDTDTEGCRQLFLHECKLQELDIIGTFGIKTVLFLLLIITLIMLVNPYMMRPIHPQAVCTVSHVSKDGD
ncbi:predicted protein [Lichtheimia corymbifera JMRC:FSU:9682]|uniref:Uncharacterized protein n=1 Tax=Lichtheimia corymbifera JMRC:FSU:9682 TaxID=1263082 RepID=A0A068SGX1_9FUNG|nr:predicted protein [Lichtheimia corymbifera JMRC:FSU:9682]